MWSDGSPTDYLNWHRTGAQYFDRECGPEEASLPQNANGGCGQPDNASEEDGGEHEDCGELYPGFSGEWNVSCRTHSSVRNACLSHDGVVLHRTECAVQALQASVTIQSKLPSGLHSSQDVSDIVVDRPPQECLPVANAEPRYVRVDEEMGFADAQSYCREHFHDLASIHNAHENGLALLACQGGGTSAIMGEWADQGSYEDGGEAFYRGHTVTISEEGGLHWTVDDDVRACTFLNLCSMHDRTL